jgi:hypothetical protein
MFDTKHINGKPILIREDWFEVAVIFTDKIIFGTKLAGD